MTFRIFFSFILLISSTIISIADERKLTGKEVSDLLPKIIANGQNYSQTFTKNGLTTYVYDGRPSEGRWMVQGDQYCSTWPPNNIVECYDVTADTEQQTITWIGPKNSISKATYKILEN